MNSYTSIRTVWSKTKCTVCPTRYWTWHFFNNSNTNEDIVMKFEQEYVHCVRNEKECVCSPYRIGCLVWDVPVVHNWSYIHHNSCIYGNLQHLCKSTGWWGTLNWIFPAGWRDIPHFTCQNGWNSALSGDRVILKGLWPPRSPNLKPPDYFLWGYLKGRVPGKDFPKYGAPGSILSGRKWCPLPAHVMMSSHFLHNEVSPLQISLQYSH